MQQIFHEIKIKTKGQGLYDFTEETLSWLKKQNWGDTLRAERLKKIS